MSRYPIVSFEPLPGWFEVRLDEDPGRWAKQTARLALEAIDEPHDRRDTKRLRDSIAGLAQVAVQHRCAQAIIYCPDPTFGPRLLVELVLMEPPETFDAEFLGRMLGASDDARFRPDEIEPFTARAGEGFRAIQRWVDEHSHVYETWFYTWCPAGYDVLVVASTTFADLTLAGLAQSDVDEFMATCNVEDPDQAGSQA